MRVQEKILELKERRKQVFDKYLRFYESDEIGAHVLLFSNKVDGMVRRLNKVEGDVIPEIYLEELVRIDSLFEECLQMMNG